MIKPRLPLVIVAAAAMIASITLTIGPASATHGFDDCVTKANDPHRTDKGILAKSTIEACQNAHNNIEIWVTLWRCPDSVLGADGKPTLTYTWLINNCDQRAGNRDTSVDVPANTKVTRQAPPVGSDIRLTQAGMWVNATNWTNADGSFENRFRYNRIAPA